MDNIMDADVTQELDPIGMLRWNLAQVEETIKKTAKTPTNARALWAKGEQKKLKAQIAQLIKAQAN